MSNSAHRKTAALAGRRGGAHRLPRMSVRARVRRFRVGADRYDTALFAIAHDPDAAGRAQAHKFLRKLHAEHPSTDRICTVPDCCSTNTTAELMENSHHDG